jgi:hypothetical protein
MATMKSPGLQDSSGRNNLGERLAIVMQASRAIRSELALTICESREMRLASRQLRTNGLYATQGSVDLESTHWMAHAIAQALSNHGYCAFVARQTEDTALIQ